MTNLSSPVLDDLSSEFSTLRRRLHASDESSRLVACRELIVVGAPFSSLLLEALVDPSSEVRKLAAEGILKRPDDLLFHDLAELLRLDDAGLRSEVITLLIRLGERVLPVLRERLCDDDDDVRIFAANISGHIGAAEGVSALLMALTDPNPNVRYAVVEALGKIGDARAIPFLLELIERDEWTQFPAIEALGRIGDPAAIPILLKQAESSSWLRVAAIEALGRLGDPGMGMHLLPYLEDENPLVGHTVIAALGRLDQRHDARWLSLLEDRPGLEALLISALDAPDVVLRATALRAMGWIGRGSLLRLVVPYLGDPEEGLREAAREALKASGLHGTEPLIAMWRDQSGDYRPQLAEILGELGEVSTLLSGLDDPSAQVRAVCASLLSLYATPQVIEVLKNHLDDPVAEVREAILKVVGCYPCGDAAPLLLDDLMDPSPEVRYAAAQSLGKLNDPGVIPQLAEWSAFGALELAEAAVQALGLMEHPAATRVLVQALNSTAVSIRRLAVFYLGQRSDPEVLPALKLTLQDSDWQVRKLGVEALVAMAAAGWAPEVSQLLRNALNDGILWVCYAAVRGLGAVRDQTALPELIGMLKDDRPPLVFAAAETLGELQAAQAVGALVELGQSYDIDFRRAAADALARIPGEASCLALQQMRNDPDPLIRRVVTIALKDRAVG